jgi:REP-associated tyrosine transposase
MGRALRIEFAGASYHVMARGYRRERIVLDDVDRQRWVETLEEGAVRCGWQVLAYALMSNHYHVLMTTPEANLVAGMKWFQSAYATRFRSRHRLVGGVFAGRYKALLIERDNRHLGTVMDYIHLNGWRAGLVKLEEGLNHWPWSSLPAYASTQRGRPGWLEVAEGLRWQGFSDTAAGRQSFLQRLEERARMGTRRGEEAVEAERSLRATLKRGWLFGSQAFEERMHPLLAAAFSRQRDPERIDKEVRRDYGQREAERLIQAAMKRWGWTEKSLLSLAKGHRQKVFLAWWIRQRTQVPVNWLRKRLNLGVPAAASRLLAQIAKLNTARSKAIRQWKNDLTRMSK